jgi:hypothetical protein
VVLRPGGGWTEREMSGFEQNHQAQHPLQSRNGHSRRLLIHIFCALLPGQDYKKQPEQVQKKVLFDRIAESP